MSATDAGAASAASAAAAVVHHAFAPRPTVRLNVQWGRETFVVQLELDETVDDLRAVLQMESGVRPENQKLFGLKLNGKAVAVLPGSASLRELVAKDGQTVKMMGSSDDDIEAVESALAAGHGQVLDDLDYDYAQDADSRVLVEEARLALEATCAKTEINLMCAPRPGKRLLVLDLDHTLLDFSTRHTSNKEELKRPYMDAFLTSAYRHYDLACWSQTKLHWIEIKLTELGIVTNPNYHLCFALDRSSMFAVTSEHKGELRKHEVKALEIIWRKFPAWSAKNTVHVDDLSRNFALNPQSGLQCSPFKRKRSKAAADTELLEMAAYLESIAEACDDFSTLDHAKWRDYLRQRVNMARRQA
jgi:ubiquitin-like domain-containing CTD phosphatase 1